MGARDAWSWLQANDRHGLQTGGMTFYAVAPGVVEVCSAGSARGQDMGRAEFLSDFSSSTFVPLDD